MKTELLLIDGDRTLLLALCELLASEMPGISVTTACSGNAAVTLAQQDDYDAIVSDIRLPDIDGFTLMGKIQSFRPDTPVLLMTASDDYILGLRALKQGAYAFVPKPIDNPLFMAWLTRALQVRGLSRDLQEKRDHLERQKQVLEQAVQERTVHLQRAVTALKQAQHVNQHFAALVESSEDAILSNSTSGVIQSWNHGAQTLYGYSSAEAIGQHISLLIPRDRQAEEHAIRERIVGGERVSQFETVRLKKDGSRVHVSLMMSPILEEDGRVIGVSKIARDITERKRSQDHIQTLLHEAEAREAQLVEKQAQLVQAAKLASIGELTTGIAHELNNPLNNISLLACNLIELLRNETNQPSVIGNLELIQTQVSRAATIINHLRTFGRASSESREPVSLNEAIRSSLSFVHDALRMGNISVQANLSPHELLVRGNRIRLEQVFVNLLTNARDALEQADTKQILIESRLHEATAEVLIRDTGCGIAPDVLSRIFDPFFTTKPSGQGTGLGLSINYGIIKEHHGNIEVESSPGKGTTFVLRFPVLQSGEASR